MRASKAFSWLYYKACDRYYHWYVHEDTGFRLHRRDMILYGVTFWIYVGSEEVYWIAKRAGVDDKSWPIRVSSALIVTSAIMFMYYTHEIRKLKKAHEKVSDES